MQLPTRETAHAVCNAPPAFTVRGNLSLLETVIANMAFVLTESGSCSALTHGTSPGIGWRRAARYRVSLVAAAVQAEPGSGSVSGTVLEAMRLPLPSPPDAGTKRR